MPVPSVYVPASVIFPGEPADFAAFRATLRTLSRTDTLFWCARLSLVLQNPQNKNEFVKQEYCVRNFLSFQEIELRDAFVKEHRGARVFFREQLLELIRWTSLLSEDLPDDGGTFDDPEVRRRFLRAALIASDLWGQRVYRQGLDTGGDLLTNRRRSMAALREGVGRTAPEFIRVLVRGDALYRSAFQAGYAGAEQEFRAATGLTLEQYMTCVRTILIHFGYLSPEAISPTNWGGIAIERVLREIPEPMQVPFDSYMRLESQTPDELQRGLWGARTADDVREEEVFDTLTLRERPLLRTPDGRAIILDQVFYADKAAVGPLFALVSALNDEGKRGKVNEVFEAFGLAFEEYVNTLLCGMYPSSPLLPSRLHCNPYARTRTGDDVEIADACLDDVREVALFESKGVFVPDDATHDTDSYLVALRKKYGESGGRRKGAAQLGRWIQAIASGDATPLVGDWSRVEVVYPVLVVYDPLMDRPGHAEFLAEEFAKALEPETVLTSGYMKTVRFAVAPLAIVTMADLELLESSVKNFRLIDLLREYALSMHNGVRESLHDYLAFSGNKYKLSLSEIAGRALKLVLETRAQMFPHIALPGGPLVPDWGPEGR